MKFLLVAYMLCAFVLILLMCCVITHSNSCCSSLVVVYLIVSWCIMMEFWTQESRIWAKWSELGDILGLDQSIYSHIDRSELKKSYETFLERPRGEESIVHIQIDRSRASLRERKPDFLFSFNFWTDLTWGFGKRV